ncbi:hypothetical protein LTR70_001431 [Exophiala xenobiotica]|uniref:Uncharacterized protein n=1 Tax=Lithohypha guttulata TaxID=1690604 RepID=A0ABR0KNY9_9EURO|nr:hypothetical protein LTR24_000815 [Lithohypha guttulata]KAK5328110.1 hypothetical protein LTR70_001431 [Exophiala xenobiotica]
MGNAQSTLDNRVQGLSWIGSPKGPIKYEGQAYYHEYQNATLWAVGDFNPDITKSAVGNAYEIHGGIRDYHVKIGGGKSVTGAPVSDETTTADGRGRFNQMQNGYIYWSPATGAHEVYGNIMLHWQGLGSETSWLGYPTSGEIDTPGGRMNSFENGQVVWRNGVASAIGYKDVLVQKYNQIGGIYPRLGLPLSTAMSFNRVGNGFMMPFRGGSITVPFDSPVPAAVATQTLRINWTGLECQVRQEGEDELAGAVSALAPSTKWNNTKKFPDGNEPWKLGHEGARIMYTNFPIYEGPPANVVLTTALVELDTNAGNPSRVADQIVSFLGNASGLLDRVGALSGNDVLSGYGRELGDIVNSFKELEKSNIWRFLVNLFDSPDDPYPAGVLELKWDDMQRNASNKKVLRRSDDGHTITWTDSITVIGRDNGGDVGVYAFYFDVNIIASQDHL